MAGGANFDFLVIHAIAAMAAIKFNGIAPANYHKQNASNGADWKILQGQARQNTNGLNGRANASEFGFLLYCRGRHFDWPLWRGGNAIGLIRSLTRQSCRRDRRPSRWNLSRQTAQALQLHPESVRDFLRQDRIRGFRVGRRWRVSAETLASLLKTGVPLTCDKEAL